MGMFDSVLVNCPRCKKDLEFQSKAGACDLLSYDYHNVPPEIAVDLNNVSETCMCGKVITLKFKANHVSMYI